MKNGQPKKRTVEKAEVIKKLEAGIAKLKQSRKRKLTAAEFFQIFIDLERC